ncbi:sensor histidine kinase [Bacillus tuaregi]|uniref:sensor histidine kinase n=1 Tax=Bacillus tuaregi TaxID=1816695 RepID=UPI0008F88882|nr:ATP-binding protein [Bacillus tuaregi]
MMKDKDFKKLVSELSEGIVIMDSNRRIIYINEQSLRITGWQVGESVPYCSYCQLRQVDEDEERCILANENPLASFRSHMPNYVNTETDFEMSMKKHELDGQVYQVLMIKNPSHNNHDETVKMQELLIQETMLAQESERKRIAMELHDHIGQSVYSIYLGLDGIKRHVQDPEYHEKLEKMNVMMEQTLHCLKRLTKELRPRLFDNLGFETALRSAVEDWQHLYKADFSLTMNIPHDLKLEKEEGLHIFRIIQEAVNNAIRHGKATKIKIEIYTIDQVLYFQISDNGLGFDLDSINGNGVGLKHMKERVKMFNGDIKWISQNGQSTRIEGYITIEKGEEH